MMVRHGCTWISGVACASVSLPIQDRLRPCSYGRLGSGRLRVYSLRFVDERFSASIVVLISTSYSRGDRPGWTGVNGMQLQPAACNPWRLTVIVPELVEVSAVARAKGTQFVPPLRAWIICGQEGFADELRLAGLQKA